MTPEAVAAEVDAASLLGPGRRRLPGRAQVVDAAQEPGHLPGGQRRRVRAGHLQGPPAHRARPAPDHRGRAHLRLRPAGHPGLHLPARRVRPRARAAAGGPQRGLRPRRGRAATSSARASRSTSSSTRAPAPTSAARRRRCSSRSRASAASPASSRRSSRPPSASTASPPWSTTSRPCPTSPGSCNNGGAAFAALGAGRSTGHPAVRPGRPRAQPGRLRARDGQDHLPRPHLRPGARRRHPRRPTTLKAFIPGGVSAPWFGPDQVDLPLGQDEVGEAGSMLGSGSVVVMDDGHLRGAGRLAHHQVLLPRVVRPVHAVPRGRRAGWSGSWTASRTATGARRTWTCSWTLCDNISPGVAWPPQQTTICVLGPSIPSSIASGIRMFRDEFLVHVKEGGCPFD